MKNAVMLLSRFQFNPKFLKKNLGMSFVILNIVAILDILIYQFTNDHLTVFFIFIFAFFGLIISQIIIIKIAYYFHKTIGYLTLVSFFSLNTIYCKVLNYKIFFDFNFYLQILISLIIFLIALIMIKRNLHKLIIILLVSSLASWIIILIENETNDNNFISDFESKIPRFNQTPNVYLIGIDALAPKKILKEYLNDDYNFSHFVEENISRYKNSFGMGNTRKTWGSIVTLGYGSENSRSFSGKNIRLNSFRGLKDNLLFKIFKQNKYNIYTGFTSFHLGQKSGNKINEFRTFASSISEPLGILKASDSCLNKTQFLLLDKFYGLCNIASNYNFNKKLDPYTHGNFVINYISEINNDKNPKLFLYHMLETEHVSSSFNYNDLDQRNWFKKHYKHKFELVNHFIENLIDFINHNDNNAIVLVFGDHGVWFNINDWKTKDRNKKNYILDMYATQTFYLKTNNLCSTVNSKLSIGYVTPHIAIGDLLNCLSPNNELINNDFYENGFFKLGTLPDWNDKLEIKFRDFLYE